MKAESPSSGSAGRTGWKGSSIILSLAPTDISGEVIKPTGEAGTGMSRPPFPTQRAPVPGDLKGSSMELKSRSTAVPFCHSTPWGPVSKWPPSQGRVFIQPPTEAAPSARIMSRIASGRPVPFFVRFPTPVIGPLKTVEVLSKPGPIPSPTMVLMAV